MKGKNREADLGTAGKRGQHLAPREDEGPIWAMTSAEQTGGYNIPAPCWHPWEVWCLARPSLSVAQPWAG